MNIPITFFKLLARPGSDAGRRTIQRLRSILLLLSVIPLVAYPLTLSDYLNKSSVTASSDQFEPITTNNDSEVQIIPNAELIIVKKVDNGDGGDLEVDDFNLTTDAGTLVFGAGSTTGDITTYTSEKLYVAPDTYSLVEADVAGYLEGDWSCTAGILGNDAFDAGEVTLAFGEQAICEITNDDIAPSLSLVKSVSNDHGGDLEIEDFDMFIDGGLVASGDSILVMANEDIVIREPDLAPYTEGVWDCIDANGLTADLPDNGLATGTTIQLSPGAEVTCSITNTDLGVDLSIVKTVDDPTPTIGQIITFTLTVVNNGPDVATAATVSDTIPAGFTYEAGTIFGGDSNDDTDPSGVVLGWTINALPVGAPILLTFDAKVNAP